MPANPKLAANESAVADVVGTLLLVGLTVSVAAGLGAFILAGLPGPTPPTDFHLEAVIEPNCPWGAGNETIALRHLGGEALLPRGFAVHVSSALATGIHAGTELVEGGDQDARFEIGETWRTPARTIAAGSSVALDIRDTVHDRVVFGATLAADPGACGGGP